MEKLNIKNYYLISCVSCISLIGLSIVFYRNYCHYQTFKKIDVNFKQKEQWEKDLKIYSVSMPKFFINGKKKSRCVLLIGGYKDIPYIWEEFEKYLIADGIDYYAPRTCGNGRSFFQIVDWKDWVITYMEAMYILQEQYETVDIIGFSTGAVIAVYISQFKYKCKINNLFLCAPFLTSKKFLSIDITFGSNIFSKIFNKLFVWTLRYRPKFITKYKGYRDTYNDYHSTNDYYEIFGDVLMESVLFEFIKFRPETLLVKDVVILYPNDDSIIGDIGEQVDIIKKVYKSSNNIQVISIPSYVNNQESITNSKMPLKSGHIMFKEKPEIVHDIYLHIKKNL